VRRALKFSTIIVAGNNVLIDVRLKPV